MREDAITSRSYRDAGSTIDAGAALVQAAAEPIIFEAEAPWRA